ncbi:MAG: calcium/sodium antiporter [Thermoplasmatota archaeon]
MFLHLLGTLVGLVLILLGSNFLVDGGAALARKMRISGHVIGITLVATATSLPELSTSVTASITGNSGIAVGNVVGSNAFNIGIVLAVGVLITTTRTSRVTVRDGWMVLLSTFIFGVFSIGKMGRIESGALLILYGYYIFYIIVKHRPKMISEESRGEKRTTGSVLLIILGALFLLLGSPILVRSSSNLAVEIGVRDSFIGLTLIAVGTSLPELVTSIIAALKKETGIAVGNVFGSNIFNILLIIGVSGLINPIPFRGLMNPGVIPGMILITLLGILLSRRRMGDLQGILLIIGYIAFLLLIVPYRFWPG